MLTNITIRADVHSTEDWSSTNISREAMLKNVCESAFLTSRDYVLNIPTSHTHDQHVWICVKRVVWKKITSKHKWIRWTSHTWESCERITCKKEWISERIVWEWMNHVKESFVRMNESFERITRENESIVWKKSLARMNESFIRIICENERIIWNNHMWEWMN